MDDFHDPKLTERLINWTLSKRPGAVSQSSASTDEALYAIETALAAADNKVLNDAVDGVADHDFDAANSLRESIERVSMLTNIGVDDGEGGHLEGWGGHLGAMVMVHSFDEATLARIEANLAPQAILETLQQSGVVASQGGFGLLGRFTDLGFAGDFARAGHLSHVVTRVIEQQNTEAMSELSGPRYSALIPEQASLHASLMPALSVGPIGRDPNLMDQADSKSLKAKHDAWQQRLREQIAEAAGVSVDDGVMKTLHLIAPQGYWNAVKSAMLVLNTLTGHFLVNRVAHTHGCRQVSGLLRYDSNSINGSLELAIGVDDHGAEWSRYLLYAPQRDPEMLQHMKSVIESYANNVGLTANITIA